MQGIDLETLSLKDLRTLQAQVNRAIANFTDRKKQEAVSQLEEVARAHGFSLSELVGGPRRRTPPTAKYANPADPSVTWSGRGRQPRWFQEALTNGVSPETLVLQP